MCKELFAIGLLLIAFGCSNDSEDNVIPAVPDTPQEPELPQKASLLTVTTNAPLDKFFSGEWIIVHDNHGAVLAVESVASEGVMEILTDKPVDGNINVTQLHHYVDNNSHIDVFTAFTHCQVEKGKHMVLKRDFATPVGPRGSITVMVSNVVFLDHFSISFLHGASYSASLGSSPNSLVLKPGFRLTDSKAIVTIFDGESLRHRVLNDIKPNDSFSFSFDDMVPFDKTVEFAFPETENIRLYVRGGEPDFSSTAKYSLITHDRRHLHSNITAGYLNSLGNYTTHLFLDYPDFSYEFFHEGSIPDGDVSWPHKTDFNISKTPFKDFQANSVQAYIWRNSIFSYDDDTKSISWSVSSSSGDQVFRELPWEETGLPAYTLDSLKHRQTTFYTQSQPFKFIVDNKFQAEEELAGSRLAITIK